MISHIIHPPSPRQTNPPSTQRARKVQQKKEIKAKRKLQTKLTITPPNSATTHTDLLLRARAQHIPSTSLPAASILTAIGATGLSLYNFGQTISLPLFTPTWRPTSFYDKIGENSRLGLHSLLLLDIKVKEPDWDALIRGKTRLARVDDHDHNDGNDNRNTKPKAIFMTAAQAIQQLLSVEEERREGWCSGDKLAVVAARVGSGSASTNSPANAARSEQFVCGTLSRLRNVDIGPPLHSLVLVGRRTHELEREMLRGWVVDVDNDDDGGVGTGRAGDAVGEFDRIWARDYATTTTTT